MKSARKVTPDKEQYGVLMRTMGGLRGSGLEKKGEGVCRGTDRGDGARQDGGEIRIGMSGAWYGRTCVCKGDIFVVSGAMPSEVDSGENNV